MGRDARLAEGAAHPFYSRLNQTLNQHDFDEFVEGLQVQRALRVLVTDQSEGVRRGIWTEVEALAPGELVEVEVR